MMPRRRLGTIPRVGVEIEVVRWEKTTDPSDPVPRNNVCKELIKAGLMEQLEMGDYNPYEQQSHNYNCKCATCGMWEKHDSNPYPVQFTLEYDGSLPYYCGGEFITSPFIMTPEYLEMFWHGWDIVTNSAVRELKYEAKNGGYATPSIHVHASTFNPRNYNGDLARQFQVAFAPEIFVLALSAGLHIDRGMKYRHLDLENTEPKSTEYMHHRYMNVQHMTSKLDGVHVLAGPHIELRTWEADYSNTDYIQGAIYTTAALSQIMSSSEVMTRMLGYTMLRSKMRNVTVLPTDKTSKVIDLVDVQLFKVLRHALLELTFLSEWNEAAYTVDRMFDTTMEVCSI